VAFDRDGGEGGWEAAADAATFDAAQAEVLDAIKAAARAALIERRISDESGAFRVWVSTVTVEEELP
jgi:hypothetical protein